MIACDVGNSRVSMALVAGWQIAHVVRVPLAGLESLGEVLRASGSEGGAAGWPVVMSSVNASGAEQVRSMLASAGAGTALLAGRDFGIPLAIAERMPRPEQIGTDRLLAALGAWRRYGRAAVVVDVGTAITVDSVDGGGVFQGGAILAGPATAAWSLRARTAALPEVAVAGAVEPVGRDTEGAIRAGLVYGAAAAIDRLVEEQLKLLPEGAVTVATGGGYGALRRHLRMSAEYVGELVLEGLVAAAKG